MSSGVRWWVVVGRSLEPSQISKGLPSCRGCLAWKIAFIHLNTLFSLRCTRLVRGKPSPSSTNTLIVPSKCGLQFYLTEADLGKPRAAACVAKLAELNRYVAVRCRLGEVVVGSWYSQCFALHPVIPVFLELTLNEMIKYRNNIDHL